MVCQEALAPILSEALLTLCCQYLTYKDGVRLDGSVSITIDENRILHTKLSAKCPATIDGNLEGVCDNQHESKPCGGGEAVGRPKRRRRVPERKTVNKRRKDSVDNDSSNTDKESKKSASCMPKTGSPVQSPWQPRSDLCVPVTQVRPKQTEDVKNVSGISASGTSPPLSEQPIAAKQPKIFMNSKAILDSSQVNASLITKKETSNQTSQGDLEVAHTDLEGDDLQDLPETTPHNETSATLDDTDREEERKILEKSDTKDSVMEILLPVKSAVHSCPLCKKIYRTNSLFKKHLKTHKQSRAYSCSVCSKTFVLAEGLKKHEMIHQRKPFLCDTCGKAFCHNQQLIIHRRDHTGEKPFACRQCGKVFKSEGLLQSHELTHSADTPWMCDVCGKSFKMKSYLQSHSRVHSLENPYACDACDKTFKQVETLIAHKETHTLHRKYVCMVCSKSFKTAAVYNEHVRCAHSDRNFSCPLCGKEFKFKSGIRKHKQLEHNGGKKPWLCSCGQAFALKAYLKNHEKTVHGDDRKSKNKGERKEQEERPPIIQEQQHQQQQQQHQQQQQQQQCHLVIPKMAPDFEVMEAAQVLHSMETFQENTNQIIDQSNTTYMVTDISGQTHNSYHDNSFHGNNQVISGLIETGAINVQPVLLYPTEKFSDGSITQYSMDL